MGRVAHVCLSSPIPTFKSEIHTGTLSPVLPKGHLLLWTMVYIRSNLTFPSVHVTVLGHQPVLALLSRRGPVYKQTALGEGLAAGLCFLPIGNHQSKNAHKLISVQNNKLLLMFFSFWSTYEAFFKLTPYGRDSVSRSLALWCVFWAQLTWDSQKSQVNNTETFHMFWNNFPPEKWRGNISSQLSRGSLERDLHVLDTLWTLHVAEQKKVI